MVSQDRQKVTPKDHYRDPYIVGLLVGLAQHQERFDKKEGNAKRETYRVSLSHPKGLLSEEMIPANTLEQLQVQVLLGIERGYHHLALYTANISSAILDKFHGQPAQRHLEEEAAEHSFQVQIDTIPCYPLATARERVLAKILPPSGTAEA